MGLNSVRFAGVPELEACAVTPSAHLKVGGAHAQGHHVSLVQQALIDVGYSIPSGPTGLYGQQTAAAVLAYKSDRSIFAPGVTTANNVCGVQTIAYLDREILDFDAALVPCWDVFGPIAAFDLDGVPVDALNALAGRFGLGPFVSVAEAGEVFDLTAPTADGSVVDAGALVDLVGGGIELLTSGSPVALTAPVSTLAFSPALAPFPETVAALAGGSAAVLDLTLGVQQLIEWLQGFSPPTPATAARDMTHAQARDEVVACHLAGEITVTPDPTVGPFTNTHIDLSINVIAGITFKVAPSADRLHYGNGAGNSPLRLLDVRHVVGLVRLCRRLRTRWGATEIHHIGVNGSGGQLHGDCHQAGRACDLISIAGTKPDGSSYLFTVMNDWGGLSVPNLTTGTGRLPAWPHVTMRTRYRLLDHPTVGGFEAGLWQDLYATIAADFQDRTQGPGAVGGPTAIGDPSSIMTPDHPTSNLSTVTTTDPATGEVRTKQVAGSNGREAHNGHVHFQIGATGKKL